LSRFVTSPRCRCQDRSGPQRHHNPMGNPGVTCRNRKPQSRNHDRRYYSFNANYGVSPTERTRIWRIRRTLRQWRLDLF